MDSMKRDRDRDKSIAMYACGECGTLIPRVWALRHCGYCARCEWMTIDAAQRRLIVCQRTIHYWIASGRVKSAHVTRSRVLIYRADIEHVRDDMQRKKSGWIGLASGPM